MSLHLIIMLMGFYLRYMGYIVFMYISQQQLYVNNLLSFLKLLLIFKLKYPIYHYHAMALLMFEWSTPSMNIFFMLNQIEKGAKKINKTFKKVIFYSSVLFAITFFIVRMLWGNYHYYLFIKICYENFGSIPVWIDISLLVLIGVAFLLNSTWMYHIVMQGVKTLTSKSNENK